jgi:hypothetical protein
MRLDFAAISSQTAGWSDRWVPLAAIEDMTCADREAGARAGT